MRRLPSWRTWKRWPRPVSLSFNPWITYSSNESFSGHKGYTSRGEMLWKYCWIQGRATFINRDHFPDGNHRCVEIVSRQQTELNLSLRHCRTDASLYYFIMSENWLPVCPELTNSVWSYQCHPNSLISGEDVELKSLAPKASLICLFQNYKVFKSVQLPQGKQIQTQESQGSIQRVWACAWRRSGDATVQMLEG